MVARSAKSSNCTDGTSGANRAGCAPTLRGANVRGAEFRDADLTTTVLRETDLTGADFTGADLSTALLPKGWNKR